MDYLEDFHYKILIRQDYDLSRYIWNMINQIFEFTNFFKKA